MMGITGIMMPIKSFVMIQHLLEQENDKRKIRDIFYAIGKSQAEAGIDILVKRFGFTPREAFRQMSEQEIMGFAGFCKVNLFDEKRKMVVIQVDNPPYASHFKKLLGVQNEAVDHYMRGLCAGLVEYVFQEEMICVETACIGKGDEYCQYIVRTKKYWLKNSKGYEDQLPSSNLDISNIKKILNPKTFFEA